MPLPKIRRRERPLGSTSLQPFKPFHDNFRLATEYVSPDELNPPPRILRKHGKRNIKIIVASIREHGFNNPILIDDANRIVCGYGRWLAAEEIGIRSVPVIRLSHLTPEQIRLYRIADNKIAEQSEFDLSELRIEFQELEALELDLNLELTGYSTTEIDQLVTSVPTEPEPADELPEIVEQAVTHPGDLWQLGAHRLVCADSLQPESYVALLEGKKAQMGLTDAPYNLKAEDYSGLGQHRHGDFAMAAGEMTEAEFTDFIAGYSRLMAEHSVDGSIHFHCMDWRHMGEMLAGAGRAYAELKNLVVWKKASAGMGTFYRSQHELLFVWKNGKAPHVNNFGLGDTGRYRSNVWEYPGNNGFHRDRDRELAAHGTVKPWSMFADAMRDCSRRGGIILDPFGGYGTTLIAAERTNRKARVIEIDPRYCDAAIRRWEDLTGNDAILVATGQTFAEVMSDRSDAEEFGNPVPDNDDGEEA